MKKHNISRILAVMLAFVLAFSSFTVYGFSASDEDGFKNVIVLIGDGMGENHLNWTKAERNVALVMESLPYRGQSRTDSLSGTTDSAAGGTALSSGLITNNSNVGTFSGEIGDYNFIISTYMNTCEVAKALGKKAGVLSSDVNSGATPAAFSAHTTDRDNTEDITNQQLSSNLDLIWAVNNGLLNEQNITENGWEYVDGTDDIDALGADDRSFGAFKGPLCYDNGSDSYIPLSELTTKAIEQLDNEKGFFLMVEGAHIDKGSHSNDKDAMMNALIEFDRAVASALAFAKEDGNTLIVVTADHETGGITLNEETGEYEFTKDGHSSANVPLLVYGSDTLVKDGKSVKNKEISRFTAKALGYTAKYPVFTVSPTAFSDFFKALFGAIGDLFK